MSFDLSRRRVGALATLLGLTIFSSPAFAKDGCAAFSWPVEADIRLLAIADRVASGASVSASIPKAFRVQMVPAEKADFAVAPEKPFAPGAPAGTLKFVATSGLYQFTMTDRLWLDVVQDGKTLPQAAFSGAPECDGARKSVRFALQDGPALLQFSGSPARTVAISITRDPSGANR